MTSKRRYKFKPDYAVPPGHTLKETLESRGISQAQLSDITGISEKTISLIVHGKAPLSMKTAIRLQAALGIQASFWNRLELAWKEAKQERGRVAGVFLQAAAGVPVSELRRSGKVKK